MTRRRIAWAYEQLELDVGADAQAVRRAFRRLARQWHPDVSDAPDAAEHFGRISDAYDLLSSRDDEPAPSHDDEPMTESAATEAVRVRVEVDIRSTRCAQTVDVTYAAPRTCTACAGAGRAPGSRRCGICRGTGQQGPRVCRSCGGARRALRTCPDCRGRGRHVADAHVRVPLPAGVRDGERLAHGPVLVEVAVRSDPRCVRDGDDVVLSLTIDPVSAMIGTQRTCVGLAEDLAVCIPAGTQPGDEIILPGHGFPSRIEGHGDARVVVWVAIPAVTDATQVALLRTLNLHEDEAAEIQESTTMHDDA